MSENYEYIDGSHYLTDYDGIELEIDTGHSRKGSVFIRVRSDDNCSDLMLLNDDQCDKLIEILQLRKFK